jgi:hypothetical protein
MAPDFSTRTPGFASIMASTSADATARAGIGRTSFGMSHASGPSNLVVHISPLRGLSQGGPVTQQQRRLRDHHRFVADRHDGNLRLAFHAGVEDARRCIGAQRRHDGQPRRSRCPRRLARPGLHKLDAPGTGDVPHRNPHYFAASASLSGTGLPTSELTFSGAAASARAGSAPASFRAARMALARCSPSRGNASAGSGWS